MGFSINQRNSLRSPACAGKSYALDWMDEAMHGSPPRVRGKAPVDLVAKHSVGITPTCAGKRRDLINNTVKTSDHPRVCGEKLSFSHALRCVQGSPPRVRGKVLSFVLGGAASGITPACAGKSQRTYILAGKAGDHPRVCGEKYWIEDISVPILGSPPRVRGKVLHALLRAHLLHITPACAGKSDSVARLMPVTWDHPRVCGEKLLHRQT